MFNLRKEQLSIFETVAAKEFENRILAALRERQPGPCASLGDANLEELVRYGIGRAKSYGIVAEPDVCKYVDVMVQLGKDFDVSPIYPWAARTLNDSSVDPTARINRLAAEALESLGAGGAKGAAGRE